MIALLFIIILFLSFWVFFIPKSFKYHFTLFLLSAGVVISSAWCFELFACGNLLFQIPLDFLSFQNSFVITIDRLSAFFILVINLTVFIGFLYAKGYLEPHFKTKNAMRFSIHYFSYLWLYFSMILVVSIRDGLSFIIAWEIMALSSFLLVIFDAEDRSIMKTGINYLMQMHVGMFFILIAFLIVDKSTGQMSFDVLKLYFSNHSNFLLFFLFFIGFGISRKSNFQKPNLVYTQLE